MGQKSQDELKPLHQSKASVNKKWNAAFVFVVSQAMFCKGLVISITGPTFHFLMINTNSTTDQLSNVLSGRAFGVGAGALAFSFVKSKVKDAKPVKSSSIVLFMLGLVALSTPFIRSLILLAVVQTLGGFALGYSETGLISLYLTLWGEAHSRPYIQSNYFMFSIGGFVAPLFAKPFLEMASQQRNHVTTCPGVDMSTFSHRNASDSESHAGYGTLNPVSWSYVIISVYTFMVAILFRIIAACKVEDKIHEHNDDQTESRPEGRVKDLWMFFLSLIMFIFFCVSSYLVYQSYLYSTAVCSDLKMSASTAAVLNSLFWGAFGIGRGLAVITSRYFKPSTIIKVDLLGTTSTMVAMSIWGETSAAVMWIGTFAYGVFVASLLPSAISWSSQVTNMTGKYLFLFLLGGSVGTSAMSRVGGAVFQLNPFSVIYLITGFSVANVVCFALMNLTAKN